MHICCHRGATFRSPTTLFNGVSQKGPRGTMKRAPRTLDVPGLPWQQCNTVDAELPAGLLGGGSTHARSRNVDSALMGVAWRAAQRAPRAPPARSAPRRDEQEQGYATNRHGPGLMKAQSARGPYVPSRRIGRPGSPVQPASARAQQRPKPSYRANHRRTALLEGDNEGRPKKPVLVIVDERLMEPIRPQQYNQIALWPERVPNLQAAPRMQPSSRVGEVLGGWSWTKPLDPSCHTPRPASSSPRDHHPTPGASAESRDYYLSTTREAARTRTDLIFSRMDLEEYVASFDDPHASRPALVQAVNPPNYRLPKPPPPNRAGLRRPLSRSELALAERSKLPMPTGGLIDECPATLEGYRDADAMAEAASTFDEQQTTKGQRARSALSALSSNALDPRRVVGFNRTLREAHRLRFVAPEGPLTIITAGETIEKVETFTRYQWSVADSCWSLREKWSDSGPSYYETDEVHDKAFELDLSIALRPHTNLAGYIVKLLGGGAADGAAENSVDHEQVAEVGDALRRHRRLLNAFFDVYAMWSPGATVNHVDDIARVSKQAYTRMVSDMGLIVRGSFVLSGANFDQVFIQISTRPLEVETGGGGGKGSPQAKGVADSSGDTASRALNRPGFLECVVRIAGMRYVETNEENLPSRAVERMLTENFAPTLRQQLKQEPNCYGNAFRQHNCYTWGASEALKGSLPTIKAIYEVYSSPLQDKHDKVDSLITNRLMSFDEWVTLMKDFELLDPALTVREISLIFTWSRLQVIDERTKRSRFRRYHLSLEDFFEALIRLSMMKALPSDMEMAEADVFEVADFFDHIKKVGLYDSWVSQHEWDVNWEDEDSFEPKQLSNRALDKLIELIVHTVVVAEGGGDENQPLTKKRVDRYRKDRHQRK